MGQIWSQTKRFKYDTMFVTVSYSRILRANKLQNDRQMSAESSLQEYSMAFKRDRQIQCVCKTPAAISIAWTFITFEEKLQ